MMNNSQDTPVEYRGYYIVRDMIQPGALDRSDPNSAENTRFGIMRLTDGKMKTINWALSEEAARAKIDEIVAAEATKRATL